MANETSARGTVGASGRPAVPAPADGRCPPPQRLAKVLVAITEDWFALSHFQPLIRCLVGLADEVVVATRSSGRMGEIEALGARTVELAYNRSSMNPVREVATVRRLVGILRDEKPDVVHLVAMKPIVLGGVATRFAGTAHTVVHMTGLGFLAISDTAKARAARTLALGVIGSVMRRTGSWLLVENPEDLAFLRAGGVETGAIRTAGSGHNSATGGERVTLLGGAGIDPDAFPLQPEPVHEVPVAAFVARLIRPKGVDVLMRAGDILAARGVALAIELNGETDDDNPEGVPAEAVRAWANGTDRRYLGFTNDVAAVWRRSDIFVLPARSREGMPRALLEAASSGRPAVVTDVPGCRHFVTHGVEGLVVPPGDATALADALQQLALDAALRRRLGTAARDKVLSAYTEAHVTAGIEQAYRTIWANDRR